MENYYTLEDPDGVYDFDLDFYIYPLENDGIVFYQGGFVRPPATVMIEKERLLKIINILKKERPNWFK